MHLIRKLSEGGDTIVEVLIAVAIVSLTLGGAYVSANRSSQTVRTAQEQGEALKYAETQIELIKAASPPPPAAPSNFCYPSAGANPIAVCTFGPIPYTVKVQQPSSGNFIVVVTWPGLSGNTNREELDYAK